MQQSGGQNGVVFTRGRQSSWAGSSFFSLQEVGKQHKTGLLGRRQIVGGTPIMEQNKIVTEALGEPQDC